MRETTGGFTTHGLESEAQALQLPSLSMADALEIGGIALAIGLERSLPIAVEVRMGEWILFHASLPGSVPERGWWISRKCRVVLATGNSTMYERVWAEERDLDWHKETGYPNETHAIHGGAVPLNVAGEGLAGILAISGLPQVEDHLLCVEVIAEFLARKGELQ